MTVHLALWLANPPAADRPSGVSCTKRIVGLMVWHCDITCVCQVHDTCCHLACSGPDGYFYDVPHSWPRGTGHLLQISWLEFVTETTKESFLNTGFEYICGVLRLCAQNTLTVLLFTCNSPKTVLFLKHVSPVLVSHREPGPVTHDHQLKIQKSLFSTTQSTKQLWPVCSCHSVMKYSTIQFKKSTWQWMLLYKQLWESLKHNQ